MNIPVPGEHLPHLALLSQEELNRDEHPLDPFRLRFPGFYQVTPEGTALRTDITVRLTSAALTSLKAQIRAVELAFAIRISRRSPEELDAEQRRAAEALVQDAELPEVELLERVLVALRSA